MSYWKSGGTTETLRKIAAAISKQYKVVVNFHYGGEASHTDMQKRAISIDLDQVYKHGEDYGVGLLLHEVAHVRFSPSQRPNMGEYEEKYPETAAEVYNWLEDRRIDGKMQVEYAGAKQFQDAHSIPSLDSVQTYLEQIPPSIPINEREKAKIQRLALGLAALKVEGYDTTFCEVGDIELKKVAESELTTIYKSINKDSTHAEVTKAAIETLKILCPYMPPAGTESKQGGGKGQAGEHDHGQCGGKGQAGEHDHGQCGGKVIKDLGGWKGGGVSSGALAIPEQFWLHGDRRAQEQVSLLKKKLIAKLRDTEHEQWEGNQRKGRLDKKRLVRIAFNNHRLYKKRLEKKGKKYSFAVLLDTSGSMWGSTGGYSMEGSGESKRIGKAMQAAATIIRATRGLGFTASLTTYGEQPKTYLLPKEVYKPETIHRRMMYTDDRVYQSNDNITHRGIKEALKHLLKQQHEKVLVIITDGGLDSGDIERSAQFIADAKKKGVQTIIYYVEAHGSKILNDPTRERVIENSAELVPATIGLIKSLQV